MTDNVLNMKLSLYTTSTTMITSNKSILTKRLVIISCEKISGFNILTATTTAASVHCLLLSGVLTFTR